MGWETWSEWSPCDNSGQQHRTRECLASNPGPELCQGSHRESRICLENTKGNFRFFLCMCKAHRNAD